MSQEDEQQPRTQIPKPEELPDPSYRQSLKVFASVLFLAGVQMPLAMRNLFMIRRKPAELGHQAKFWYLFVAVNLPITLYFAKNARKEIRENRQLEQLYLESVAKYGCDDCTQIEEAAITAMRDSGFNPRAKQ